MRNHAIESNRLAFRSVERKCQFLLLLLARHPAVNYWPANHNFRSYELHIESLGLLDFYGGMKQVDVDAYFNEKLPC